MSQKILLTTINVSYIHRNLALRWLATSAPEDFTVDIREFTMAEDDLTIANAIIEKQPSIVGFGVYIYNVEKIKRVISILKQQQSSLRILLGGPEISWADEWWFDLGVEALFVGEAEVALYAYLCGQPAEGLKTRHYQSEVCLASVDLRYLESLKPPYFLEEDKLDYQHQYFYLESSRGCPFSCSYCFAANEKLRFFSESYLMKIINQLVKKDIRQIKLLDRSINASESHARWLILALNQLSPSVTIQMEMVIDHCSDDFFNWLQTINNRQRFRLEIGIQSLNEQSLQAVGRQQNNELLLQRLELLKSWGFQIHGDLLAGLPYDNLASFASSFDRLYQLKLKELQVGILKLLKNTTLKKRAEEYHYSWQKEAPYQIETTAWMNRKDLQLIADVGWACERFYNNNRLENTLEYLIEKKGQSAFSTFALLAKVKYHLPSPYDLRLLFLEITKVLGENDDTIRGLLNLDYYHHFNQRVQRLFDDAPEKQCNVKIREYLKSTGELNYQQYDNYSTICQYPGYYLIFTVRPKEKQPQLIWLSREKL